MTSLQVASPAVVSRLPLSACGETLTLRELAAVLGPGWSTRTIERALKVGTFPIPTLRRQRFARGCQHTFSRRAVERFLEGR